MTKLVTYVGSSPAELTKFETWLGRKVDGVVSFADDTSWTNWNASIKWSTGVWQSSGKEIYWSLPLITKSSTLAQAASGQYDQYYTQAAKQLVAASGSQSEIHIRVGWEFNISSMPWYAKGHEADYIGAYRDFVDAFRSVSNKFVFEWNAGTGGGMNPETAYPGDQYVDLIGSDVYYDLRYNSSDPIEAFNTKVNQNYGLQWQADFAAAHHKQIDFGEWSVQSDTAGSYIDLMADWIAHHDVAYQSYWNSNSSFTGKLSDNQYPTSGAAYRNDFFAHKMDAHGTIGADQLVGGSVHNVLYGGTGDDTYVILDAADRIVENAGEGTDGVRTSLSYILPANVENLWLQGSAAVDGTGNELANTITGNNAANRLTGGAGDDTLNGSYGNDTLDGGTGADTMVGGTGDDTYVIDNIGDKITEKNVQGTDTVLASIDYTLGGNLENLTLTGSAIQGSGNSAGNVIIGNVLDNLLSGLAGDDTLSGGAGDDVLNGGKGMDQLTGGTGADRYVFDDSFSSMSATKYDRITDFSHAQGDRLDFSLIDAKAASSANDAFTFIGGAAFSAAGQLRVEYVGSDTLITGNVAGNSGAEFGVVLTGHIDLTASDFVL